MTLIKKKKPGSLQNMATGRQETFHIPFPTCYLRGFWGKDTRLCGSALPMVMYVLLLQVHGIWCFFCKWELRFSCWRVLVFSLYFIIPLVFAYIYIYIWLMEMCIVLTPAGGLLWLHLEHILEAWIDVGGFGGCRKLQSWEPFFSHS